MKEKKKRREREEEEEGGSVGCGQVTKEVTSLASLNDSTAYISSVTLLDVIFMTLMWNFFPDKGR